jgi:hypothetical protein
MKRQIDRTITHVSPPQRGGMGAVLIDHGKLMIDVDAEWFVQNSPMVGAIYTEPFSDTYL